ncbi:MAG: hypothetical protein R3B99_19755 [Polyangiales bacterium]
MTVDGGALPFERAQSPAAVRTVLERLLAGGTAGRGPEYPGGPCIALRRGRASITLEPGAQLEISGAPLDTIHETVVELREPRGGASRGQRRPRHPRGWDSAFTPSPARRPAVGAEASLPRDA